MKETLQENERITSELGRTRSIPNYNCCRCGGGWCYRGADKSLARPGRKQATATDDFDVHISYLLS